MEWPVRPVAVEQRNQTLWGQRKREGGREGERKRDKERERSYRRQKEGHWVKWIETDRCEETDIVNGRERDAALDVLVNFCLSALVKMSHINVQINGCLIFQPAPYCHHQMALLSYLLMTRAEFPPPWVSVYCELLLISLDSVRPLQLCLVFFWHRQPTHMLTPKGHWMYSKYGPKLIFFHFLFWHLNSTWSYKLFFLSHFFTLFLLITSSEEATLKI